MSNHGSGSAGTSRGYSSYAPGHSKLVDSYYDSDSRYSDASSSINRPSIQWPISNKSVVKLPINDRSNPYSTLLVATGSDISFLKVDAFDLPFGVRRADAMTRCCYPHGTVRTLGTGIFDLHFGRTLIEHEFHLIPEHVNLEHDGILGMDFVLQYACSFNFQRYLITMNFND